MSVQGAMRLVQTQLGKCVAFGTVTPTSATHDIDTGLGVVDQAWVSFEEAQTLTHNQVYGEPTATPGEIRIFSYKPTATNDATPIAATTPWSKVAWVAIGTLR